MRAQFDGDPVDMVDGEKSVLVARPARLKNARFWSPEDPYLYDVYTILKVDGKVVDVNRLETGFRKTEFKGGAGTGGVYINDKFVYLKGFAERASRRMGRRRRRLSRLDARLSPRSMIRECHGNYMRWMHISPQKVDADSFARFGIVQVCPAGDKERDVTGRQWDQRVEVMRDSMIYFRNNPSILFWEAGNTVVTPEQMQQMVDLRKQWDPDGGRVMGYRDNDSAAMNEALTPIAEYYGVMIGQAPQADLVTEPRPVFRGYSVERRDRAPLIETEDFRDEGARRYLGRLLAAVLRLQERSERHLSIHLGELRARRGQALLGLLDQPHLQHRSRRTPSGRATARSTSPTRTRTDARTQAKLRASAARWTRCACPRKSTSPIA